MYSVCIQNLCLLRRSSSMVRKSFIRLCPIIIHWYILSPDPKYFRALFASCNFSKSKMAGIAARFHKNLLAAIEFIITHWKGGRFTYWFFAALPTFFIFQLVNLYANSLYLILLKLKIKEMTEISFLDRGLGCANEHFGELAIEFVSTRPNVYV